MRAGVLALGLVVAVSPAFAQSEGRLKALEEERARNEEAIRQLQAFDVLGQKPGLETEAVHVRKNEVIVPNVSIYCVAAAKCNEAAAKLCADIGYKASRPLRPNSASSGVVCSDP